MNDLLKNEFSLIKINESKLSDITYVCYLESLDFDNFEKNEVSLISDAYMKLRKKSEKILRKKLPNLAIYNYQSEAHDTVAPIQPHDSKINMIRNKEDIVEVLGEGSSFKNYENYNFQLTFDKVANIKMEKITYENGNFLSKISLEEKELDWLSNYFYREVFFDETNTLKKEITMVFINQKIEEDLIYSEIYEGKRELVILNFDFENVSLNMSYRENNRKLKY